MILWVIRVGEGGDVLRKRKFRLARTAIAVAILVPLIMVVAANRDDVVQAQRLESVLVSIKVDGTERDLRTAQTTVGSILVESGIEVGPQDVVTPATDERPYYGMIITVVRVSETIEDIILPVSFSTVKTFSKSLRPGLTSVVKPGVLGEKLVYYKVRREDGIVVKSTVESSKMLKNPVKRVVSIGSRGIYTSRGTFRTLAIKNMVATAYDPGPRSCGRYATGRTSCGLRAGYGVVAVDPRIIKLGTKLYIEGYGFAIAGDVGRAIKGRRIDLGFTSYREAIRFGRRGVKVHILQGDSG